MSMNQFLQQVYSDFSGGFNDSVAGISIKDNEVVLSENAEYSAEIKSFKTRKGSKNINLDSFAKQLRTMNNKTFTVSFSNPGTLPEDKYEFIYKDNAWHYDDITVNLSSYGLTVSGTVIDGDKIILTPATSTVKSYYSKVEVTDAHIWSIGSIYKRIIVIDSKVYDYNQDTDRLTLKTAITAGATRIYPFVVFNKFYFGDGTELYCIGDYDFSSEAGTASVPAGKIVRNNDNSTTGDLGHFYQAKVARDNINLATENYKDTEKWTDVTEVPQFASSVARVVTPYDPSQPEIVYITVVNGSTAAGTITLYIDDNAHTVSVGANASINTIVDAIKSVSITGWTAKKESNTVIFTKNTNGLVSNGYVDAGDTGCVITYTTTQEGKINDNNLAPIKKCTMFIVHTASYRVFATGNPDDNAVFYSEIGNPTYFKSDYNRVYGENRYGKPTAMMQLSESILVSYENGWYVWSGINALEDARWKPLNLPYGCMSPRSIALTPHSFVYLGKDGLYNVSVSILNSDLVLIQGNEVIKKITGSRVDNTIASIDSKEDCVGYFRNNVYYLAYNTDKDEGNTRVLKFEWETKSFTENTGWKVNAWFEDGYGFYFASTNYLMQVDVGICDVDAETGEDKAINLHIKTKEYHFGNPFVNKVVRLVGIIFKQTTTVSEIDADCRIIMGYNDHIFEYNLNTVDVSESLVWGRNWGRIWGFREAIVKMVELTQMSNTFQLEIKNNKLNSPLTVVAIGFVYEPTDFVIPTILKDEVLLQ